MRATNEQTRHQIKLINTKNSVAATRRKGMWVVSKGGQIYDYRRRFNFGW